MNVIVKDWWDNQSMASKQFYAFKFYKVTDPDLLSNPEITAIHNNIK